MTKSSDETEIRDAVVARLRELMPSARIVHELNVEGTGTNRIDVAAVTTAAVVAVEIKSRKDTLKRLDEQWAAFNECCHFVIVAAHDKHFADYREERWREDVPSKRHLNHPLFLGGSSSRNDRVWRYPRPEPEPRRYGGFRFPEGDRWFFEPLRETQKQPKASALLGMLWADELREECARHRLTSSSRATRPDMIADMVWHMTGKEICTAVCRQLRARRFAEADPEIFEQPIQASMIGGVR